MGDVTRKSALRDVVVTHALDPEDAAALIPIQTAARTQKGAPWRLESRKFYDALMEGVLPRAEVTFESATIGGVPGVWVHPASSRSD
ncbi:MAG TPA: esterase, partial [Terriglobia bacterium]|nr:esterase [Terriglobia bacterium]